MFGQWLFFANRPLLVLIIIQYLKRFFKRFEKVVNILVLSKQKERALIARSRLENLQIFAFADDKICKCAFCLQT